jgi:integrase
MRGALDSVARMLSDGRADALSLPWFELRYAHVQAARAALADRLAPATVNKVLAAIRGVARESWLLGLSSADEYQRIAAVPSVKGDPTPRGRALSHDEVGAVFAVCDPSAPSGIRNAALLALLYGAGLRRAEAVGLDLDDFDLETGVVIVRRGKGGRRREVPLPRGARDAVEAWLLVRGSDRGPLLVPVSSKGSVTLRRLSTQSVYAACRRIVRRSSVARFSPHDLRRSYVTDLLGAGADLALVQRLAGHANVATTTRYDRRGDAARAEAAALLNVPFVRPVRVLADTDNGPSA